MRKASTRTFIRVRDPERSESFRVSRRGRCGASCHGSTRGPRNVEGEADEGKENGKAKEEESNQFYTAILPQKDIPFGQFLIGMLG